jgi:hypothetical protein
VVETCAICFCIADFAFTIQYFLFSAKKETTQRIAVLSPLIRRLIQSACLPKKENISLLVLAYHQRRSDDFAFIIIYLNDFAYECLRKERKLSYY